MEEKCIYLVDTENVSSGGFVGIEALCRNSKIYYFYSSRSYRASYAEVEKLRKVKCKLEFIESAKTGINALDFQITSYLGYLIGKEKKNSNNKYIIISNDTGYDAVINFWIREGKNVSRQDTIGEYAPILDEDTDEIIENGDQQLEHAYNQLSSVNKRKLNYPKVVSLSSLNLKKDRYSLILASIYKSVNAEEFEQKIKTIPNSQLNEKKKRDICEIVMKDFRNFRTPT